jgi:hypothetical protein
MKALRRIGEFAIFLTVFLIAFGLYQMPDTPTKFIYYNF